MSFFPFSLYRGSLSLVAGSLSGNPNMGKVLYIKQLFDEVSSRFDYPAEILFNYSKSFLIPRDVININMSQENYLKLEKRIQMARERGVINREDKSMEVDSALLVNNRNAYKAKVRLRGTYMDHAQGDKWSFRVKVKKGRAIYGMNRFSLHDPRTRMWLWEWLYQKALAYAGLMYLDYRFVDLYVNGESRGVYALEEFMHFNLIEKNKRRDGILLREDSFLFNRKKVEKDPKLRSVYNQYKVLLHKYSEDQITMSDFYDIERLAKHFAITQIFGSGHTHFRGNWITYFNPLTNEVEVIGYDSNSGRYLRDAKLQIEPGATFFFKDMHIERFFGDREFVEKYLFYILKYSEPAYFDGFFSSISEQLDTQLKIIWRTKPWQTSQLYKDVIYKNQAYIIEYLSQYVVDFENIQSEEVEKFMEAHGMVPHDYDNLDYEGTVTSRDLAELKRVRFIDYDQRTRIARIREGAYTLLEDLIIPSGMMLVIDPGVTLNLDRSSSVVSYSPVSLLGTAQKNIKVIGRSFGNSFIVMNAKDRSEIQHSVFRDLSETKNNPSISGSVTFYESEVEIRSSVFANNTNVDDHLNIIRSNFVIENTKFSNSYSDAIDIDFSRGRIDKLEIDSAANDGVDFSNSTVNVTGLRISGTQDKAVSIGEGSHISISNALLDNSKVGVAIKDSSTFWGEGIQISNTEYGYALYNKKPMYGMPKAEISKSRFTEVEHKTILERGSSLSLNGSEMETYSDVKKELQL
jgi:hypothetical protein|tara:strand:- start:181 stop:2415 length:2235 start_codon:yes stop_codon:yes gene_type:complete